MKSSFFFLILSLFLFTHISLKAQYLKWEYLSAQTSWDSKITLMHDGSILQSRSIRSCNEIAKITPSGNQEWEKSIIDKEQGHDRIIASFEGLDTTLFHITWSGRIYTTDSQGDSIKFLRNVLPDSLDFSYSIRKAIKRDNIIHIRGVASIRDTFTTIRASFDLENLIITYSFSFDDYPLALDFTKDGKKVELFWSHVNVSYKVITYNRAGDKVFEKIVPRSSDTSYYDVTFDANDNIILVGLHGKRPYFQGIVTSLDFNGNQNWTKLYSKLEEGKMSYFQAVTYQNDRLLIGGTIGEYVLQGNVYILSINLEGDVIWEYERKMTYLHDDVNEIIALPNSEVLVSGICGQTDISGSERAYILNLGTLVNNVLITSSNNIKIFPNPSSDYLQINGVEDEVKRIEIYNTKGQKVYQQKGSFPINVIALSSGSYIVKIFTKNYSFSKQWIKN